MPTASHYLPSAIFDRHRVRAHRERAAASKNALFGEMAERMAERVSDFNRAFPRALMLGAIPGLNALPGVETLVGSDLSLARLGGTGIVADEEFLPFADNSFDLVVSAGSLHWVNDLPGALIQICHALKPGGLFIAMLPGGETLAELRESFEKAELAASGGISPRVSPFIDAREGGSLLQRAGFVEPVTDSEMLTLEYSHPLRLMHELRALGETSALFSGRKGFTPCSLLMLAVDHYLRHFSNEGGRVKATLEIVTLAAWKSA